MSYKLQFRKLTRYVRRDGLLTTTRLVANHVKNSLIGGLEGLSGYYNLRLKLLQQKYDADTLMPEWVSPDEITAVTGEYTRRESDHLDYVPYFKPRETGAGFLPYQVEELIPYGTVRGGEWDQNRPAFDNLLLYRGAEQRFLDGRSWDQTVYYRKLFGRFRSQGWSPYDASALASKRCERVETLYRRVEEEGYRSQRVLDGHPLHEVTVNVARDGTLLYNSEGRHRLSIAKILDVEEIPVLVLVRHENSVPVDGT